ncbi:cytochrome c oxidase assembly protein [bacterium]|nr:cytochrome c oxidase assembly protein [bacterium]
MSDTKDDNAADERISAGLIAKLVITTLAMFGFGFALVPLYEIVCEITGFNGRSEGLSLVASVDEAPVTDRTVRVEFLTSVNRGMPWEFAATQDSITVHPGKLYTVEFTAENSAGRDMVGQARPSVAPWDAAKYLRKTECFCFNRQPMQAGETKVMPMRFMLDPELPAHVDTVTLSYTFFEVGDSAQAPADNLMLAGAGTALGN